MQQIYVILTIDQNTCKLLFFCGILLLVVAFIAFCLSKANKFCNNFLEEFSKFGISKQGSTVLHKCIGCNEIIILPWDQNSRRVTPSVGLCFKNLSFCEKKEKIVKNTKLADLSQKELINMRKDYQDVAFYGMPYFFEMKRLKTFFSKYNADIFTRIGLFFNKNKKIIEFLAKYVKILEKSISRQTDDIGKLLDSIDNSLFRMQGIPETVIRFENKDKLNIVMFLFYKSHKVNFDENDLILFDDAYTTGKINI
ncbi:hypothetical protein CWI36_1899p0010 [Hamiltosporidium magnivora]|uniref:Uncharacterized protein n=1 Tax=Hamiltosporidium magnivora TaxID=148818 RepID=A0A4Q9KXK6_9MICR|nr:hypothetical protein CWI36_1899p0010 [Hamiltosporidium magnivora]